MKTIIFIIFICTISCANNGQTNTGSWKNENGDTLFCTDSAKSSFENFLTKFVPTSIPVAISPLLDKFPFERELNRNEALKYLCNDKNECLKEPGGGYYQHYYMNIFSTNRFTIVSYYRTSSIGLDCILTSFTKQGKKMDEVIIAGQIDNISQMEANIDSSFSIVSQNIVYGEGKTLITSDTLKAQKFISIFSLSDSGKFILKDKRKEEGLYVFDKKQNFRLVKLK